MLFAYTYDPFNRLVNAGGAAFVISAEDQRVRKLSAGDENYYATAPDGTVLAQTQYDGAWSDYVWLNGRAVARVRKGHIYAIYADQTGRPLVVTNSSDSVVWAAKGFAFDRQVTVSGSVADVDLGFPGQWRDEEDGLWHNGYRDYNADTGRYIQSDPIGFAGGVNTYAYVGNNPVSNVDPTGLRCMPGVGCWTTPAEANLANSGQYGAYYALACSGGDGYACFAGHVASNDTRLGQLANDRLVDAIDNLGQQNNQCENTDAILEQIRRDLAQAYANYLPNSQQGAQWPQAWGVAQLHWEVFAKFGLPPSTFGGSPLGPNVGLFLSGVWCPNCQ